MGCWIMALLIKILTIHWYIIQKMINLLKPKSDNQTIEEYLVEVEKERKELNTYVLRLLINQRDEIQALVFQEHRQALKLINDHIEAEWGKSDDETEFDSRSRIEKVIEVINLYILTTLISTTSRKGTAERKFDDILKEVRTLDDIEEVPKVIEKHLEKGIDSGYQDISGLIWRIPRQIKAIVDHLYNDTFNEVLIHELERREIELVRVDLFDNPRDACRKLQDSGIICIVPREKASEQSQKYPNIWDSEHLYGHPAGHHGINCRHVWHNVSSNTNNNGLYDVLDDLNVIYRITNKSVRNEVKRTVYE